MDRQNLTERRITAERRKNNGQAYTGPECRSNQNRYDSDSGTANAAKQQAQVNSGSQKDFQEKRAGSNRRGSVVDRRLGLDRRRGPGIRRSDERKSAEEGQMSSEQFEFILAVDEYKRQNSRPFPTWTEVLELIKALGYRKVAEPQPLSSAKTPKQSD